MMKKDQIKFGQKGKKDRLIWTTDSSLSDDPIYSYNHSQLV